VASGSGGGLAALAGNPSAYADIQLKDAQQERERSAAALNDAEADWYKSQTVDKDLRERLIKAQAGLAEAGITESSSRASLNAAITLSYSIDNELKDAAFGYNLELIKADLGKAKEEYYQLKARTGYIDDLLEGELQLLTARAIYLKASASNQEQLARVNELTASDLENWFDVNWNTQVEVPIINEKGKVERTIKMTGKEIRREYMKLNLQDFQYDMYTNRWELRSEKNRFGYSIANTAVSGAISLAGHAVGAKVLSSAPPVQRFEDVTEELVPTPSSLGGGWTKHTSTTSRQIRR
jgi:hypothetical protein